MTAIDFRHSPGRPAPDRPGPIFVAARRSRFLPPLAPPSRGVLPLAAQTCSGLLPAGARRSRSRLRAARQPGPAPNPRPLPRRTRPFRLLAALLLLCLLAASPLRAETVLSVYSGWQGAGSGDVRGRDAVGAFAFRAAFEGRPFEDAPYYGLRLTRWLGGPDGAWAVALDFAHSKLYADAATLARSGFGRLEFTHGLNVLSLNALRRFEPIGPFTPYLGAGAGIAIPHVEVTPRAGPETLEYQFGGPALVALAGASWRLGPRLSLFAEIRADYVWLDIDLAGGGRLRTDTATSAANLGLSLAF